MEEVVQEMVEGNWKAHDSLNMEGVTKDEVDNVDMHTIILRERNIRGRR